MDTFPLPDLDQLEMVCFVLSHKLLPLKNLSLPQLCLI
nr:MAG TPA: hypothetical protein [Bacteriophage sp.]